MNINELYNKKISLNPMYRIYLGSKFNFISRKIHFGRSILLNSHDDFIKYVDLKLKVEELNTFDSKLFGISYTSDLKTTYYDNGDIITTRTCNHCGFEIHDDERLCIKCGHILAHHNHGKTRNAYIKYNFGKAKKKYTERRLLTQYMNSKNRNDRLFHLETEDNNKGYIILDSLSSIQK